ncbi:MAG: class I SAM-dependent methyltransferase [Candidatus Eremiobacterota bacterium]
MSTTATQPEEKKARPGELASFLSESPPEGSGFAHSVKMALGFGRPDLRNPVYWLRASLYGPRLVGLALDLAARAPDVADLGCGSGWFSLEVARRNRSARVLALDKDAEALAWARSYYESRRSPGRVQHVEADLATHAFEPDSLDVAVAFFVLGAMEQPLEALGRIHRALRPGGLLVYYDGTEPPGKNLERLSRWRHRYDRWRGRMSDPWTQHRKLEAAYRRDTARCHRPETAPDENEVYGWLLHHLHILHQSRQRAFTDLALAGHAISTYATELPVARMLDDVSVALGWLDGATRFVVGRKR